MPQTLENPREQAPQGLPGASRTGPFAWSVPVPGHADRLASMQASEDWILFDLPLNETACEESELEWLLLNASLPEPCKCVLMGDALPHLRAEYPMVGERSDNLIGTLWESMCDAAEGNGKKADQRGGLEPPRVHVDSIRSACSERVGR